MSPLKAAESPAFNPAFNPVVAALNPPESAPVKVPSGPGPPIEPGNPPVAAFKPPESEPDNVPRGPPTKPGNPSVAALMLPDKAALSDASDAGPPKDGKPPPIGPIPNPAPKFPSNDDPNPRLMPGPNTGKFDTAPVLPEIANCRDCCKYWQYARSLR